MNYKTLIAFLGKKQMKDWSTPNDEWILLNDDRAWREEAIALGFEEGTGADLTKIAKRFFLSKDYETFAEGDSAQVKSNGSSYKPTEFNPFYDWIAWYNPAKQMVAVFCGRRGRVFRGDVEKMKSMLNEL
jgi:hypothetical protein